MALLTPGSMPFWFFPVYTDLDDVLEAIPNDNPCLIQLPGIEVPLAIEQGKDVAPICTHYACGLVTRRIS
jgi:hypothetical protein